MQIDDPGKDLDVKPSKIMTFLKNRMFLVIAGAVLLIAVALSVYSVVVMRDRTATEQPTVPETETVETEEVNGEVAGTAEVLPQQVRSNDNDGNDNDQGWTSFEANVDPFSDPMKLTGVLYGGRGGPLAIIESSGTSFIVSEGDYVDDLWAVRSIVRDSVVLRAHNQEVRLYFDQAPETRSLEYDMNQGEEEHEEGI